MITVIKIILGAIAMSLLIGILFPIPILTWEWKKYFQFIYIQEDEFSNYIFNLTKK